jgi:hypothetical protein
MTDENTGPGRTIRFCAHCVNSEMAPIPGLQADINRLWLLGRRHQPPESVGCRSRSGREIQPHQGEEPNTWTLTTDGTLRRLPHS